MTLRPLTIVAAVALLAAACGDARGADDRSITVLAASSLTEAFTQVAAAFEDANPGTAVQLSFAGSQVLAAQLSEGAPADLFASADEIQMARAARAGLVGPASDFATNRLVIVTPAADPGEVSSPEDLARDGVTVVLAGPDTPAGRYAREALDALGLRAAVERRVVSFEADVKAVAGRIAQGEADAGIVYATDVRGPVGERLRVVDLDAEVAVIYQIAVTAGSGQPDVAGRFVEFVLGDGADILARAGFGAP